MTLLTTVQDAAKELGLPAPSTVVTNTSDQIAVQLLALANRTGRELRSRYDWPQLIIEYTFDLATSTAAYAMPADFDRFAFMTHWDRDMQWEVHGPVSAEDWQFLKSGTTTNPPRRRWRFKTYQTNQFFIDPTPASGDNGFTLVFEYYTKNWLRPKLWTTSTVFAASSWCFYNGNYYSTSAGGTNGATPPTHTTGSASDGAVTWAYSSAAYESYLADNDVSHIDENLITLGIKWRYRQAKGLDGWDLMKAEFDAEAKKLSAANIGARTLNMNEGRWRNMLPYPNAPENGFG